MQAHTGTTRISRNVEQAIQRARADESATQLLIRHHWYSNTTPLTIRPAVQQRLDLVLDRKRLCNDASALAGSSFPVLFRFIERAHRHEHGLSAVFVILLNDGYDHFCNASNRAVE
jgi:hypothetical protein